MIYQFNISTKERYQLVDITDKIEDLVLKSEINNGSVFVFLPHSTAAIILTENERGLKKDWLDFAKKLVSGFNFEHDLIDNNADSHILSGLLGQGKTLPFKNKKILRGTWQQIFLFELDGPKNRTVIIQINQ